MKEFFDYSTNFGHRTTILEILIPIFITFTIIYCISRFRYKIKTNIKIDKLFRICMLVSLSIFYISNYILLWMQTGFNIHKLPLQLCSISALLCIILLLTNNKKIFNFVIFSGVLGGIGSILSPDVSCSWMYYRYYQFMGMHSLIAIVPMYYAIIYKYLPSKREAINVFIIIQTLAVIMGILNTIFNTDYLYVGFSGNIGPKGTIIECFGESTFYLINYEIFIISVFFIWFILFRLIFYKNYITKIK